MLWSLCAGLLLCSPLGAQDLPPGLTRDQVLLGLEHEDPDVRRGAYVALGTLGKKQDLPLLFSALYDHDPLVRRFAEDSIWKLWSRSGNARYDRMFEHGVEQMQAGAFTDAISSFSALIELAPDFTEAWNKRATVYFLVGKDEKSIADCQQVLEREPNHFGALSGYGQLMLRKHEYTRALGYFERALTVNPNLRNVSANIQAIKQVLEEERNNEI
ncbi:MAG: tetratricopeptide repeat protein [Burkholderiales bacterium]